MSTPYKKKLLAAAWVQGLVSNPAHDARPYSESCLIYHQHGWGLHLKRERVPRVYSPSIPMRVDINNVNVEKVPQVISSGA